MQRFLKNLIEIEDDQNIITGTVLIVFHYYNRNVLYDIALRKHDIAYRLKKGYLIRKTVWKAHLLQQMEIVGAVPSWFQIALNLYTMIFYLIVKKANLREGQQSCIRSPTPQN